MNTEIKQKDFTLNKVKFLKEGMEIYYQIPRSEGSPNLAEMTLKTADHPHDHLLKILENFKKPLLVSSNALVGTNVLLNKKNNLALDPKVPQKTVDDYRKKVEKAIKESVDVKGISFHGNDQNEVIKINGGFNSTLGYSGLNTPNILISDSLMEHGIDCDTMMDAIEDLKTEVFKYVYHHKIGTQEELNFEEVPEGATAEDLEEEAA